MLPALVTRAFCGLINLQTAELSHQELDKLISFSGTPTVVWRRTGEICLVAPEFCMLTEWSLDDLVGRKKYIYEVSPPHMHVAFTHR